MKIQVRINEQGALRNQRYAFSDRFSLVSELLQNARRAGARHIIVEHRPDAQILRIRDDGHGIDDFQKLLSFHESGWSEETVAQENAFGIGFTKCLYAATRVIVASGHQCVVIDTAAALQRQAFEVETMAAIVSGTVVELHGVEITGLEQRMQPLCQGFPIEVSFNGVLLERRYARNHLPVVATPVGAMHLTGLQDGKASRHTLVFLQGFCVKRPSWYDLDHVNVVHLDPQQFAARLPDRDILIDADQQLARVEAEMRSAWQKALEDAKARLEPREFVDTYFEAMQQWGLLALLNDMDEVPADVFAQIVGYPILAPSEERDYVKTVSTAPSRSDIECGRVMLVSPEWPNTENIGHWMLARHKQWLVTHAYLLDAGHWLRKHVRYIDDETLQIEAESETARATLEGRWAQPLVIMCRSVRIRMGDHQVEIVNEAVCRDGDLLVPEGEESGRAVRQLCDFCEEDDRYRDDDMQADSDTLADLILRLRYTDPVSTLNSLLTDLRLGKYPLLHGRQFAVCVGVGGMPGFSVEMLDGGTAEPSSGGVRHAGR